jgi:hypothetical protein
MVVGNASLADGADLAPGDGAGTLTFSGNLDISPAVAQPTSGALRFELAAPAASDKVVFNTGALTIGSGVLGFGDFAFTTLPGFTAGEYKLFDGNSPILGSLDSNPANLTGSVGSGFSGTLQLSDGGNDLVLVVVPEPGTVAALLGGVGCLVGFRRIRRRR